MVQSPGPGSIYEGFPGLNALNGPQGQDGSLAFWANASVDGLPGAQNSPQSAVGNTRLGIGYFLTGTCGLPVIGSCPLGSFDGANTPNLDPSQILYLGKSDGSAFGSFGLTRNSAVYQATLLLGFTANTLTFGWYTLNNPSDQHPLFSNVNENSTVGGSTAFAPTSSQYGFYIDVSYGAGYDATYFSQAQYDQISLPGAIDANAQGNHQHFVVFTSSQVPNEEDYYIGVEDTFLARQAFGPVFENNGDYNDVVVALRVIQVPEPSTLVFVAAALLFGVSARRRPSKPV